MKFINKISTNETERAIQEYFHSIGYQSMRRGWPDFCFWKNGKDGKNEYIFVEVKKPIIKGPPFSRKRTKHLITSPQRRMRNILLELGLDYRTAFGLQLDGTPDFQNINKYLKNLRTKKQKEA